MTEGLPVPGADTGGPIERDDAVLSPEASTDARAGVFPSASDSESGQDGSDDLRAPHPLDRARALAAVLDPQAFDGEWAHEETRRRYQDQALHFAIKVIDAGWVRVSEDDDTIEQTARAMWVGPPEWDAPLVQQEYAQRWRVKARAALRALREGDQDD